jgi:ribosomal protein L29
MDSEELKNKNGNELKVLLQQERAMLHSERAKIKAQTLKQVHTISLRRRTIARILTLLSDKKI